MLSNEAAITVATLDHIAEVSADAHTSKWYRDTHGGNAFLGSLTYRKSVLTGLHGFVNQSISEDLHFGIRAVARCERFMVVKGTGAVYTRHAPSKGHKRGSNTWTWNQNEVGSWLHLMREARPSYLSDAVDARYVDAESSAVGEARCMPLHNHVDDGVISGFQRGFSSWPALPKQCCSPPRPGCEMHPAIGPPTPSSGTDNGPGPLPSALIKPRGGAGDGMQVYGKGVALGDDHGRKGVARAEYAAYAQGSLLPPGERWLAGGSVPAHALQQGEMAGVSEAAHSEESSAESTDGYSYEADGVLRPDDLSPGSGTGGSTGGSTGGGEARGDASDHDAGVLDAGMHAPGKGVMAADYGAYARGSLLPSGDSLAGGAGGAGGGADACAAADFGVVLNRTASLRAEYVRQRERVMAYAHSDNVPFECASPSVLSRLQRLRHAAHARVLVAGNGPCAGSLSRACINLFDEVVRFNEFSRDLSDRVTIHVVNAVSQRLSVDPKAWLILNLECTSPDHHHLREMGDPRLCSLTAEARRQVCASPPEFGVPVTEHNTRNDDPSRGFLFVALVHPSGTRMTGFSDDGLHSENKDCRNGGWHVNGHLVNHHYVREEHSVLVNHGLAAAVSDSQYDASMMAAVGSCRPETKNARNEAEIKKAQEAVNAWTALDVHRWYDADLESHWCVLPAPPSYGPTKCFPSPSLSLIWTNKVLPIAIASLIWTNKVLPIAIASQRRMQPRVS